MWRTVLVIIVLAVTALGGRPLGHAHAQELDLQRLVEALAATPFYDTELLPGFAGAEVTAVPVEAVGAAAGEVGNIDVMLSSGPDTLDGGAYTLYATVEQAHAALAGELLMSSADAQVTGIEPLEGYGLPAVLITAVLTEPPVGVSGCALQAGSVVVAGYSAVAGQPAGNPDNACALAVVLLEHMQRLLPK